MRGIKSLQCSHSHRVYYFDADQYIIIYYYIKFIHLYFIININDICVLCKLIVNFHSAATAFSSKCLVYKFFFFFHILFFFSCLLFVVFFFFFVQAGHACECVKARVGTCKFALSYLFKLRIHIIAKSLRASTNKVQFYFVIYFFFFNFFFIIINVDIVAFCY